MFSAKKRIGRRKFDKKSTAANHKSHIAGMVAAMTESEPDGVSERAYTASLC
jgi:hypothetical protein